MSNLDRSNRLIIRGINEGDNSGRSVSSAGDVNGDGIDDIIIGAPFADPNGTASGESYVVFGNNSGFTGVLELSTLDGSNGFVINGVDNGDNSGGSVSSAGDFNGDGIDDLIIGASRAEPNGSDSGRSYVVFGNKDGFKGSLELSSLDGRNGFVINGIDSGDFSGASVSSAGDFNDDGIDDLIIGAPGADPNSPNSGESYVVFGSNNKKFEASLDLSNLDGRGFKINGIDGGSGGSVSSAGDINGDGIDDLIIGASNANSGAGESYVVFGGKNKITTTKGLDLSALNGKNGFKINGIDSGDQSGTSVSGAGDVNGDGINDIIIGARFASPNGPASGESYVVFGNKNGFEDTLDLSNLDGTNGFTINGIDSNNFSGYSVSGAGDVNSDGIDDIIIGAPATANESYVVFGSKSGFGASLDLSSLHGTNGFTIGGNGFLDFAGSSVSGAGDFNNDGIDDVIIGAERGGITNAGESYVVFGFRGESTPSAVDHTLMPMNTAVSPETII